MTNRREQLNAVHATLQQVSLDARGAFASTVRSAIVIVEEMIAVEPDGDQGDAEAMLDLRMQCLKLAHVGGEGEPVSRIAERAEAMLAWVLTGKAPEPFGERNAVPKEDWPETRTASQVAHEGRSGDMIMEDRIRTVGQKGDEIMRSHVTYGFREALAVALADTGMKLVRD
jgi:hypothetical protein